MYVNNLTFIHSRRHNRVPFSMLSFPFFVAPFQPYEKCQRTDVNKTDADRPCPLAHSSTRTNTPAPRGPRIEQQRTVVAFLPE